MVLTLASSRALSIWQHCDEECEDDRVGGFQKVGTTDPRSGVRAEPFQRFQNFQAEPFKISISHQAPTHQQRSFQLPASSICLAQSYTVRSCQKEEDFRLPNFDWSL